MPKGVAARFIAPTGGAGGRAPWQGFGGVPQSQGGGKLTPLLTPQAAQRERKSGDSYIPPPGLCSSVPTFCSKPAIPPPGTASTLISTILPSSSIYSLCTCGRAIASPVAGISAIPNIDKSRSLV